MKTIQVSEATNTQLDLLVYECLKRDGRTDVYMRWFGDGRKDQPWCNGPFKPSNDWSQMGPIIEREGINLSVDYQDYALSNDMVQIGWKGNLWNNSMPGTSGFLQWAYGPTPLIAAARCYVISKLGDTADVPEELCP